MIILDIETLPGSTEKILTSAKYNPALAKLEAKFKKLVSTPSIELAVEVAELNEDVIKKASLEILFSRILCIGTITKSKDKENPTMVERAFYHETDEAALLNEFWFWVKDQQIGANTITYNGHGFDLPMLYARSMINKVVIPWKDLSISKYKCWPHFDVMVQLAFGGWKDAYRGLDYWAEALGYEVDLVNGPNGSFVSKWYAAGEHEKIKEYCLEDCRKLMYVYKNIKNYFEAAPITKMRGRKAEPGVGSPYDG